MKSVLKVFIIISLLTLSAVPNYADGTHPQGIKTDGTIGNAGKLNLPGPDYDIKAEFGKQSGANLFHSFEQFNLHKGESATFSGSDSVQNIISRVTGGSASWIDGKLGSSIPNADMYFLNPAGVMFGPNASLDLTGSFHVSTADYLRMGAEGRFYALSHADDLLSAAPPSAFGFIDGDIGEIRFEGRGRITETQWNDHPTGLRVSEGKTLSVIAGDIEMKNGTYYQHQKTDKDGEYEDGNEYSASVTETSGGIAAPGGQIFMVSAASTGEVIPWESGPDASSIEIKGTIALSGKAKIDVHGEDSGRVDIRADTLSLTDGAVISADTYGAGKGGTVVIEARNITLTNGGMVAAGTFGSGQGGAVVIKAQETLTALGTDQTDPALPSGIFSDSNSDESDAGDAGKITVEAGKIILSNNAEIRGVTMGPGKGGNISVNASEIEVFRGGKIRTCTFGSGQGGTIDILSDTLTVSTEVSPNCILYDLFYLLDSMTVSSEGLTTGIFSNSIGDATDSGKGGEVSISAEGIFLNYEGIVSTFSLGGGDAGIIKFSADEIRLADRAMISSVSEAGGGSITLEAGKYIWLSDSEISNSIRYGADKSTGSFRLDSEFLILNRSLVRTGVHEGEGGDIHIRANFISSSDSMVEASGRLFVESPDMDVSDALTVMPGNFLDAAKWAVTPCRQRSGENPSRFIFEGRDAIPLSFEDWQPSPVTELIDSNEKD